MTKTSKQIQQAEEEFIKQGSNVKLRLPLPENEMELLHQLYVYDGAWTLKETEERLGIERGGYLMKQKIIGYQDTDMGPVIQLLARGRISLYHKSDDGVALPNQVDQCYIRLSMAQKSWDRITPDMPYYRNLKEFLRRENALEAETIYGHSLILGKISGNGYAPVTIKNLGQRLRSSALSQNFHVVLLTPSPRKGKEIAKQFGSFLHLVHFLPNTGDTRKRFNPPTGQPTKATGPYITAVSAKQLQRDYGSTLYSDTTLKRLQSPRDQRIDEAILALETDKVMTEKQLRIYFGLRPADIPNVMVSNMLLRPAHGRYAQEKAVTVLTLSPNITRTNDGNINHLLLTTQLRYNLDAPAGDAWRTSSKLSRFDTPDSVRINPDGTMDAIEADTGEYSFLKVKRKLEAFQTQGFEQTHWGTLSETRIRNLTNWIPLELMPNFHNVSWWELPE